MKKIKQSVELLNQYSGGLIAVSLVGVILPLLVLCGFGLYAIFRYGYTIHFACIVFISSLLVFIPRWLLSKNLQTKVDESEEEILVEASDDWSEKETKIWEDLNDSITRKLKKNEDWSELKAHSLELIAETGQAFGKKELEFTAIEGLQLLEEVSRRYRQVLSEHVPYIDSLKISHMKWLYDVQDEYGDVAKKTYNSGMLLWRAARWLNPAAAVASELKGQILSSMADSTVSNLQNNAKVALLQEVVKVSIDLYSGRFIIEENGLKESEIKEDDQQKIIKIDPVRVVIIGQMNAGKSSLINALTKKSQTEVDSMPATDDISVHPVMIDGEEHLRFIDTPGLDGEPKITNIILKQVLHADLVIWVLRANQPARALDVELLNKIHEFYDRKENISRKKPKIIAVLNQVDRLKPVAEWSPPYDLHDQNNPKVKIINEALIYNRNILQVDDFYPLAIPENQPTLGVEQLESEIQKQYNNAITVQFNRRRNEARSEGFMMKNGQRLYKGGKELIKTLF